MQNLFLAFSHLPYHFPWAATRFAPAVLGLAANLSCPLLSLLPSALKISTCYLSFTTSALDLEAKSLSISFFVQSPQYSTPQLL